MPFTTYWSPNQAAIAQVETYTFTAPSGVGNTYVATENGKSVTYSSVSGDTAASAATALFNLLNASTSIMPELTEITFANPSSGVLTATARVPGVPFANVPGTSAGLVLSTGNGLASGITTAHTQANQSPSDVIDPQNWLRVNTGTNPPAKTRAIPVSGDNGVLAKSAIPMLWNLDQLAAVQFATFQRWQSMTGQVGLPDANPAGYAEWRAPYLKLLGPAGSVPAGGLQVVCGYDDGAGGSGPTLERYNLGSQQATLTVLAATEVHFLGIHTANTFANLGGAKLSVAMTPGEVAVLSSSTAYDGSAVGIGAGVTWTAASTLTLSGCTATLNSAPATVTMSNGAQATVTVDALTWATVTAQGGCTITFVAGGTITTLTLSQSCVLDKSSDPRALTITNHTIDGDTCQIVDPLNAITFTNAGTVRQQVASGPYVFTGPRTMKVT